MDKGINAGGFFKGGSVRQVLTFAVFVVILGGFFVLNRAVRPPEISQSERRRLAKMPAFTVSSVLSAKFMGDFEDYAADSFAFRDGFRAVRAASVFGLFMQKDKSGLYLGDSGAGKFERIDEGSYKTAAEKIQKLAGTLEGLNVYYTVIPDKSIYAGAYMPGFDAGRAREILSGPLGDLVYIDITGAMEGGDFYRTDLHWDQARLGGVRQALGDAMGLPAVPQGDVALAGEFYGVYAGQIALPMAPDVMRYVTDEYIQSAHVSYLGERTGAMEPGPMYDLDAFDGDDPYDLFLRGAQPLIVIENPGAATDRELYMFRDSFSSSLAPLLCSAYRKVTLIDLRYLDSRVLPSLVDFVPGSDALFIYSSQILGNESVLLVH